MVSRHQDPSSAGGAGEAPARLQVLLTAALFSTGGAAIKACALSSWQVASLRSGVAAVTLFLLLPAARRRVRPRILPVAASYAATLVLFVLANKLTTAASTIFLQSTAPLYVLLVAPLLLGETIRRRDVAYMVVLAGGMSLLFVGVEAASETAPDPLTGNILGACAGVSWAATVLGLRFLGRTGREGGSAEAVLWGNVLACLVALPFALPVTGSTATDWGVVAYLGIFQVGIAYVLLTRAMEHVGAFEASLLLLVEPVLNPIWAWLVHGETPGAWSLVGGAVIVVATAAKTWLDRRRAG